MTTQNLMMQPPEALRRFLISKNKNPNWVKNRTSRAENRKEFKSEI